MYPSKIIVIDDNKEHLDFASKSLFIAGFPNQPILWNDLTGVADYFPEPSTSTRIIFMDINLTEAPGNPEAHLLAEPIAATLRDIISPKNGPYLLIFWTNNRSKIEEIRTYLNERHADLLSPMAIKFIDKSQIPDATGKERTPESVDEFRSKLQTLLTETESLNTYLKWESACLNASGQVLNNLFESTEISPQWNQDYHQADLSSLAYTISKETVGEKNLEGKEAFAFFSGMTPLLEDTFINLADDTFSELLAKNHLEAITSDITPRLEKLNSAYHIDNINKNKKDRGVLIEINDTEDLFQSIFHNKWDEVFLDFIDGRHYEKLKKESNTDIIKPRTIKKTTTPCLLEISPSCDDAQQKKRNKKFLLAALIPAAHEEEIGKKGNHEGIYCFPKFHLNGEDYFLRVNYRYIAGFNISHELLSDPILRVREQILNDLVFRYGKYSSRPGIVSFY